jgi:ribonuclease HII
VIRPSLRVEKSLFREGHAVVVGCDEVGRGALSGPVSVGVLAVDDAVRRVPTGLADSKLLTPARREQLAPKVERWALDHAVGHASALEIDRFGIIRALRLAGLRALAQLTVRPDVVVLDGSHDWLSPRDVQVDLFSPEPPWPDVRVPLVTTRVKADMHCAAVAGASVLAKTTRDRMMVELARDYPQFGWDENKGYASPDHLAQLESKGPCAQHRRSWRLPGSYEVAPSLGETLSVTECEEMA